MKKEIDYNERIAKILADIALTNGAMLARLNKLLTLLATIELRKAGVDDAQIKELLDDSSR